MATNIKLGKFNLRLSRTDNRDYRYHRKVAELRNKVDLREYDSRIENQLNLGSCVGSAISSAYELQLKKLYPDSYKELSNLFVYYNGRMLEGTVNTDEGVSIRTALKGTNQFGICTEELWPYDINKFNKTPTPECYRDGSYRVTKNYRSLGPLAEVLSALDENYPVVAGMVVYSDFLSLDSTNYTVTVPDSATDYIGYHAVVLVGYDDENKVFIAKNSFGPDWGLNGYFMIPYSFARTELFEKWIFDISEPTKSV